MNPKPLSLFLFLLFLSIGFTQEIKIDTTYSRLFKERIENTSLLSVLTDKEGGVYTTRSYRQLLPTKKWIRGYIVQYWDSTLEPKSYYNFEIENKNSFIAGIFLNQNKIHLLEYVQNKKNRTIDCYAHVSSSKDLAFEKKLLFSVSTKKFPGFYSLVFNKRYDPDFRGNLAFSPNGENLIFYVDSYGKKEERHALFAFKNTLEPIWEREFIQETADKLFDLEQATIGNDGTAYILAKVYKDGRKMKRKKNPNYHFEIFKVLENEISSAELDNNGVFIGTIRMKIQEDKITCLGFYSNKTDYRLAGTFLQNVDKSSLSILDSSFQELSKDFMNDKFGDDKKDEIQNMSIREITNLSNGDFLITAEDIFIEVNLNLNGSTTETFNFNDIAVIRLTASGKMLWARNINKNQESSYWNEVLSFSPLYVGEDVFLFLNAHKKMGTAHGDSNRFKSGLFGNITKKNSNLYVIKLNQKGDWSYDVVQENDGAQLLFDARNGLQLTNSKILFFGSKDNTKQFLTVEAKR